VLVSAGALRINGVSSGATEELTTDIRNFGLEPQSHTDCKLTIRQVHYSSMTNVILHRFEHQANDIPDAIEVTDDPHHRKKSRATNCDV
jgi:hypothetical protein